MSQQSRLDGTSVKDPVPSWSSFRDEGESYHCSLLSPFALLPFLFRLFFFFFFFAFLRLLWAGLFFPVSSVGWCCLVSSVVLLFSLLLLVVWPSFTSFTEGSSSLLESYSKCTTRRTLEGNSRPSSSGTTKTEVQRQLLHKPATRCWELWGTTYDGVHVCCWSAELCSTGDSSTLFPRDVTKDMLLSTSRTVIATFDPQRSSGCFVSPRVQRNTLVCHLLKHYSCSIL